MKQYDKTEKVDAAAIYSRLMVRRRRTTAERFNLPYTEQQAFDLLMAACMAEVAARGRSFTAAAPFVGHVATVARWLTTADRRTFGLFLCGNRGNGKSTLVRAMHNLLGLLREDETPDAATWEGFPKPGFEMIHAKQLVLLSKAWNNPTAMNADQRRRYARIQDVELLAIDDLGTEPRESLSYGDSVTAAIDLISHRYDHQLTTIATSNLAPGDIRKYYDERFADRFREMMYIVDFGQEPSFRGE